MIAAFLWLEEDLSCSESLATNEDFSSIWEFIIFFAGMTFLGVFLSGLIIVNNEAHFLLNIFNDLNFGVSSETVTSVIKDLLEIGGDVPTS